MLPSLITSLATDVRQLVTSYHSFCARKTDGSVWCWGSSFYTQVGYGPGLDTSGPVKIPLLQAPAVTVAGGSAGTSCALLSDSGVWCWGMVSNAAGVFDRQPTPIQIAGLPSTIVELAVGWGHACARAGDGTVWCWGRNDDGMLGDGATFLFASLPVEVRRLGQSVVQLASSANHTCARKDDGTLWCWGSNNEGELGDGTTTDRATPIQVPLPARVRQVAIGSAGRTCAVLEDGTVWCWGECQQSDCGSFRSSSPVQISGLSSVSAV
jgi:alpha-tubulin suppressor-like RCC1 family protein